MPDNPDIAPRSPDGDWLGTPYLSFKRDGPFAICTLDRPQARNAMTPAMYFGIRYAVTRVNADPQPAIDTINFDGGAELGAALRQDPSAMSCMMSSVYRDANASVAATTADAAQIATLVKTLATDNYVWRNLVADFTVSDAFRSAPALPVMTASP